MDFRATLRNAKEFLFPPIPEPPRDNSPLMRVLSEEALRAREYDSKLRRDYMERAAELIEAKQMGGSGPWLTHENRQQLADWLRRCRWTPRRLARTRKPRRCPQAGARWGF